MTMTKLRHESGGGRLDGRRSRRSLRTTEASLQILLSGETLESRSSSHGRGALHNNELRESNGFGIGSKARYDSGYSIILFYRAAAPDGVPRRARGPR